MRRECRERFRCHRRQRTPLVNDPGRHYGTCVMHVPWCMSGSLTRDGGENVPGIPGAYATRSFTYLVRGPWQASKISIIGHRSYWFGICSWVPIYHMDRRLLIVVSCKRIRLSNVWKKPATQTSIWPPSKQFLYLNPHSVSGCLVLYHCKILKNTPDSKVHGANMGPSWGRQDPVGPHVGPKNFAIWDGI